MRIMPKDKEFLSEIHSRLYKFKHKTNTPYSIEINRLSECRKYVTRFKEQMHIEYVKNLNRKLDSRPLLDTRKFTILNSKTYMINENGLSAKLIKYKQGETTAYKISIKFYRNKADI